MVLKTQSARKNKNSSKINFLDACEDEDDGFIEGGITTDKVLSTFSFGTNAEPSVNEAVSYLSQEHAKDANKLYTQINPYTSSPGGLTPPINGEHFTVKRSYNMRPSTVRKLNALKTEHPDVNVLLNTLVDMALSHYFNYIFNEKGSFGVQEDKKVNS